MTQVWNRYRLKTHSVKDYRPMIFNKHYPWWCSGEAGDGSYAVIIAWLPEGESITKYWDDAFDVESTQHDAIEFTTRFPEPKWFERS